MVKRGPRRVSAGRVLAWRAALEYGRERRRVLLEFLGFVALFIVVVNLPWAPPYLRGLFTGAAVVLAAWVVAWVLWVGSGLSFRLNGAWAEEWTTDALRKSAAVFRVIPSFKIDRSDVDAVAICPTGVVAIETKWRNVDVTPDYLEQVAYQAARGCRSLALQIPTDGLPRERITAAVVLWGPKGQSTPAGPLPVSVGSVTEVTILGADHLDAWLTTLGHGPLGPDYAKRLADDLQRFAVARDRTAVDAGPFLRWLARAR